MMLTTMIGGGIPSAVLSFGATAVAAGAVMVALLCATAAVLIAADARCVA